MLRRRAKLLSHRDWLYLLSLLVPFVVYSLALKASIIFSLPFKLRNVDPSPTIYLLCVLRSDVFFILGYMLLWVGLFAAVRQGPWRRSIVVLFHASTILVVAVKTCAYQYFQETGTTLDYTIIALWLPRLDEIEPYMEGVPASAWMLLAVALFYAALGPWLVARFFVWWRGWPVRSSSEGRPEKIPFFSSLVLCILALGFGSLSLQVWSSPIDEYLRSKGLEVWQVSKPLMRDPFVHVTVTAATAAVQRGESPDVATDWDPENPPPASLQPTGSEEQRNVVLILLESTRAQSVTPYNEDLETTPFMDELAKSSLLADRAYVSVPYTSKANIAANCSIFPYPVQLAFGVVPEARPGGIPARCLADLLKDQGYSTAYFLAAKKDYEDFEGLVNNFGYDEFHSLESMDKEGYDRLIKGVYEDAIMLKPSEEWLTEQKESGKPFLATYMTSTAHYPYVVPERYGEERFAEDEELNRYLNAIRYQDFFLKDLFDQYKELGLHEDTVFVIIGDHGEGFGEHGVYTHGNIIYEEGLRIPMLIHDPKRFENGARVTAPVSQLDILPTIADLLGYEIEGGAYEGSSLLGSVPEDRYLMFSCWGAGKCSASLKGTEKYIYYYGTQPDEIYDLSEDPLEEHNIASQYSQEELDKRRGELLAQLSKVDAIYRGPQGREE